MSFLIMGVNSFKFYNWVKYVYFEVFWVFKFKNVCEEKFVNVV